MFFVLALWAEGCLATLMISVLGGEDNLPFMFTLIAAWMLFHILMARAAHLFPEARRELRESWRLNNILRMFITLLCSIMFVGSIVAFVVIMQSDIDVVTAMSYKIMYGFFSLLGVQLLFLIARDAAKVKYSTRG